MQTILIIGAADTGRAPMAAALLRRIIAKHGDDWQVGSAGVLGHDDDPPEAEARTAMVHLGLNIDDHRARSISDDLIAAASAVLAIDSGTAKALAARFPAAHVQSLGALAGSNRDIPDPFRMQVGAWMTYARELETLLDAAYPAIIGAHDSVGQAQQATDVVAPASQRANIALLAELLVAMPEVVNWPAAKQRLESELGNLLAPLAPSDLALAYGGLLRAALALSANPPTAKQAQALQTALLRLEQPIQPDDLSALAAQLAGFAHADDH